MIDAIVTVTKNNNSQGRKEKKKKKEKKERKKRGEGIDGWVYAAVLYSSTYPPLKPWGFGTGWTL